MYSIFLKEFGSNISHLLDLVTAKHQLSSNMILYSLLYLTTYLGCNEGYTIAIIMQVTIEIWPDMWCPKVLVVIRECATAAIPASTKQKLIRS